MTSVWAALLLALRVGFAALGLAVLVLSVVVFLLVLAVVGFGLLRWAVWRGLGALRAHRRPARLRGRGGVRA